MSHIKLNNRTCLKCGKSKPVSAFRPDKQSQDGLLRRCRECVTASVRRYRQGPGREITKARIKRYSSSSHGKLRISARDRKRRREDAAYRDKKLAYGKRYLATEAGRIIHRLGSYRHRAKHPDRCKARMAVNRAVQKGRIVHPSTLNCVTCGAQAVEYHHHKGYAPANKFEVIALCLYCHGKTNRIQHQGDSKLQHESH